MLFLLFLNMEFPVFVQMCSLHVVSTTQALLEWTTVADLSSLSAEIQGPGYVAAFLHPKNFDMNLGPALKHLVSLSEDNAFICATCGNLPHNFDPHHVSPDDDLGLRYGTSLCVAEGFGCLVLTPSPPTKHMRLPSFSSFP